MVGAKKNAPSDLRNRAVKSPVYIKPVITGVKVLQVRTSKGDAKTPFNKANDENATLILELTRKEAVTLTVAENIADIEVHKSIGKYDASDLQADSGDILQGFKSVTEYRADETLIR